MSEQVVKSPEISDETMKRFRNFITERATQPTDNIKEGIEKTTGKFKVDSTNWLIPVTSIEYSRYSYKDKEDADDLQLSVNAGPHESEVLEMHMVENENNIVCMIDGIDIDTDNNVVNNLLDTIERLEAEGAVAPAQE